MALARYRALGQLVQKELQLIEQKFSLMQLELKAPCPKNCSCCCYKDDIEATPLELLPYALHLLDHHQKESIEDMIHQLETGVQNFPCYFLKELDAENQNGQCTIYPFRPALCRMFGIAGYRGKKYDEIQLSVCRLIKSKFDHIPEVLPATPVMSDYYLRLTQIAPLLGTSREKIPDALLEVLKKLYQISCYAPLDS